jgi:hypothetical protein
VSKPFDSKLYDLDDKAKHQVSAILESNHWEAWVNPDKYGIDLLALDPNGIEYQVEVEVKHNWTGDQFPYATLHFAERKRKFIDSDRLTLFVTVNHDKTHALVAFDEALSEAAVIVKDTSYTTQEKFLEISVSSCELITLRKEPDATVQPQ